MTTHSRSLASVLGVVLLAACASAPADAPRAAAVGAGEAALDELPAQTLGAGQCALVLWSNPAEPKRIAMALDTPAVARIQLGEKLLQLPRVAESGQPIHGIFPRQTYRGEGVSLELSFGAETRELEGGAVVPAAVVEFTDASGWAALIPAAGMIACRT